MFLLYERTVKMLKLEIATVIGIAVAQFPLYQFKLFRQLHKQIRNWIVSAVAGNNVNRTTILLWLFVFPGLVERQTSDLIPELRIVCENN